MLGGYKKILVGSMILLFSFSSLLGSRYSNSEQETLRYDKYKEHENLNQTILELSDKLLVSSRINRNDLGEIAITSFVDLHKLNKTTHFGRTLSESMFDELFIRGFNVSEFRGQKTLSVNSNGEYFITRDVNLLSKSVPNKYILVGTYSMFDDTILINARIINNTNGRVVASARSHYKTDNCKILENCKEPRKIKIITDGCSTVGCPEKSCLKGVCNEENYNIQRHSNSEAKQISITKKRSKTDHTKTFKYGCVDQECEKMRACLYNEPECSEQTNLSRVHIKQNSNYQVNLIK